MPTDTFAPALQHLRLGTWDLYGPTTFRRYVQEHGLPQRDTAAAISVDALERLSPALRQAGVMVLRLGAAERGADATDSGTGLRTQFALVATPDRLPDFFLSDDDLFSGVAGALVPDALPEVALPYSVLPVLTETSLVNLAFASGLIGYALGIDPPYPTAAPATGNSTYTFRFRPHEALTQVLEHRRGQVEVDAVFAGRRQDRECLFILEAKVGGRSRSLAKHKLVYPVLALAGRVPAGLPVVPVCLRVQVVRREIHYYLAECDYPDPRGGLTCLCDLRAVATHHLLLTLPL